MLRPGHACRRTLAVPALCAASNCVTMQQLAAECWLWLPCFLLRTCLCLTTGTAVWAGSPQVSASSGMHLHAVGWYWLPLPATVCLPGCPAGKGVRAWVVAGGWPAVACIWRCLIRCFPWQPQPALTESSPGAGDDGQQADDEG